MISIRISHQGLVDKYELTEGEYIMGSGDDCSICVKGSGGEIIGHHARIIVGSGIVWIRREHKEADLSVDGRLVMEVECVPGQVIRFGDGVEIEILKILKDPVKGSWYEERSEGEEMHRCAVCQGEFGSSECSQQLILGDLIRFCPHCGGKCRPVNVPESEAAGSKTGMQRVRGGSRREQKPDIRFHSFKQFFPASMKYPVATLEGIVVLISGWAFILLSMGALHLVQHGGIYGIVASISIVIFAGGYFIEFLKDILLNASQGRDRLEWPGIDDISGLISNFFNVLFLVFVCFFPAILWNIFVLDSLGSFKQVGNQVMLALGNIVFPIVFLSHTLYGTYRVLNPAFIIPSILKVWSDYFYIWIIIVVGNMVRFLVSGLVELVAGDFIQMAIWLLVNIYFYVVAVRGLGFLYYFNRSRLGWDD